MTVKKAKKTKKSAKGKSKASPLARDPFAPKKDQPKPARKKTTSKKSKVSEATKQKARQAARAPKPKSPAKTKKRRKISLPKRTARRRMTDPIVITGIAGNLGRLITKRLHTEHSIIGIDKRPFRNKPKDVIHHQISARRSGAEDIFRANPIRALINLGLVHRPGRSVDRYREENTMGTIKLLDYCQKYGVRKVVLMSTAYVYGPQPANSNFLTEDAPMVGNSTYPQMNALIEWDMYAQSFFWKHPEIETVILRPVHVVGPNVRNAPSNYLRLKYPPTLLGFDPMLQMIHEEDLIQAIFLALEPGRRGVFNITGPGQLPLSRILKELDRTPIPIPHPVAETVLDQLWRLGIVNFPPGELPHLHYNCMVDGARAKELLGYRPRYTLRETIRSVLR